MRNNNQINPIQAIELSKEIISAFVQLLTKVGWRKKTNTEIEKLKDVIILLEKRIDHLENR